MLSEVFTSCSNSSSGNDNLESDPLRRDRAAGDEDLYSSKADEPDVPNRLFGLDSKKPLAGLAVAGAAEVP